MKTIGQAVLAAVVLFAVFAWGCGSETCPSESPQVNEVADCFAPAGSQVSYELRLCPTCNQTLSGCSVDMSGANASGGTIFLNPTVEACESSSSCGPSCLPNPATCTFTVPEGAINGTTYSVQVFDGINSTLEGMLTVDPVVSCQLSPA